MFIKKFILYKQSYNAERFFLNKYCTGFVHFILQFYRKMKQMLNLRDLCLSLALILICQTSQSAQLLDTNGSAPSSTVTLHTTRPENKSFAISDTSENRKTGELTENALSTTPRIYLDDTASAQPASQTVVFASNKKFPMIDKIASQTGRNFLYAAGADALYKIHSNDLTIDKTLVLFEKTECIANCNLTITALHFYYNNRLIVCTTHLGQCFSVNVDDMKIIYKSAPYVMGTCV